MNSHTKLRPDGKRESQETGKIIKSTRENGVAAEKMYRERASNQICEQCRKNEI
jgi:hypothetical protein